jgi:hypothetical protein
VCGDEAGNAIKLLERSLWKAGLGLDSAFSVTMPNNYIVLFDVDSKQTEHKKLEAAEKNDRQDHRDGSRQKVGCVEVHRGPLPGFKTAVVGSLFNKYGRSTKSFFADKNAPAAVFVRKYAA